MSLVVPAVEETLNGGAEDGDAAEDTARRMARRWRIENHLST